MRIWEKVSWIFMGVFIALIIMEIVREQFLIANISFQLTQISDLRQQNEQLLEEYSSLQADFMEVNQQIKELETTNKKLTEQLVNQKREVVEGWQPFYGRWGASMYYTADKEDWQSRFFGSALTCIIQEFFCMSTKPAVFRLFYRFLPASRSSK